MARILCRLFGHKMVPRRERTGRYELAPIMLPFGFGFRFFPMLMPVPGKQIGTVCERCKALAGDSNPRTEPDWTKNCQVCDQTPIVPATGMCGPCTFGEAETAGGNW